MQIRPLFITEFKLIESLIKDWLIQAGDKTGGINYIEADFKNILFGGGCFLVALDETDTPMGFIAAQPNRPVWRGESIWSEVGIYVSPAFRGKGVGKLLTAAAEEVGRINGYKRFIVASSTDASDNPSIFEGIAKKQGFSLNCRVYDKRL